MKKQYQNPTVDYVVLANEDVLTTSTVDLSANEGDWILNWTDI